MERHRMPREGLGVLVQAEVLEQLQHRHAPEVSPCTGTGRYQKSVATENGARKPAALHISPSIASSAARHPITSERHGAAPTSAA